MGTTDNDALEQQKQRRKRINRLKNTIVLTISIWMLVSFIAIVVLSISVIKLNHRVRVLETALSFGNKAQVSSEADEQVEADSQAEHMEENAGTIDYSKIVTGIDTEDNMAQAEDEHYVYLTFDSVPGENTTKLIDALNANGINATFFVSGVESDEGKAAIQQIYESGQTLGMHSFCNQYSTLYASTDAFAMDYKEISDFIYGITGESCKYYRFPGGSGNEISNENMAEYVHILNQNDIIYFDWNVSAGDAASDYSVDEIVQNVTEGVSHYKTSVVLLHDAEDKSTTVDAIGPLVEALRGMNAQILPIDENTKLIQYIKADSVE